MVKLTLNHKVKMQILQNNFPQNSLSISGDETFEKQTYLSH